MASSLLTSKLLTRHCHPFKPGTSPLSPKQLKPLLAAVPAWHSDGKELSKTFNFKNYYETMAFVNAIAFISHQQDHHPDLLVGYNKCVMKYSSHEVGGLSENDFICAAKVDALVAT
jgi:4a-hydroxytetrahydrobiopterin dehydratase